MKRKYRDSRWQWWQPALLTTEGKIPIGYPIWGVSERQVRYIFLQRIGWSEALYEEIVFIPLGRKIKKKGEKQLELFRVEKEREGGK